MGRLMLLANEKADFPITWAGSSSFSRHPLARHLESYDSRVAKQPIGRETMTQETNGERPAQSTNENAGGGGAVKEGKPKLGT